jgi:hypothetical protein
MSPIPRFARVAALPVALALACLGGCNDKGDSNPVATGGTTGITVDDVGTSAAGALDFVSQFVSQVQPLTRADFSNVTLDLGVPGPDAAGGPRWPRTFPAPLLVGGPGRAQPDVVWSDSDQAWVLDASQTDTSSDGTATLDLHFAVQYLTAIGTPQQLPDASTAAMTLEASMTVEATGSSDGSTFDVGMGFGLSMTVGGLPDGPYAVNGDGSLDMSLAWSSPSSDAVDAAVGMDWLMDVNVPADGSCPNGLVTMNVDAGDANRFSLVGTYDGTPACAWTLTQGGVEVDSGSEALPCATPSS